MIMQLNGLVQDSVNSTANDFELDVFLNTLPLIKGTVVSAFRLRDSHCKAVFSGHNIKQNFSLLA